MISMTIMGVAFMVAAVVGAPISEAPISDVPILDAQTSLSGQGPTGIDIAMMILIGIAMPLISGIMHLRDKANEGKGADTPAAVTYKKTLVFLWLPTLLLAAAWIYQGRSFDSLGLSFEGTLTNWIGLAVAIAASVLFYTQIIRVRNSDAAARGALKQIEGELGVEDMLPTTKSEYRLFQILSISAGITEEILFRAFLVWGLAYYMPMWVAATASLTAFALAHLYQESMRAILRVVLAGGAFTLLYLLSDSLLNAIIAHAAVDLGSGGLFWYARQRVDKA